MKTYAERLESCRAAIDAIEGGAQEVRHGDRMVRRGDLVALYAQERHLTDMIRAETRDAAGGISISRGAGL